MAISRKSDPCSGPLPLAFTWALKSSATGINSGTGLSGSTGWHNSVRARMFLKTPPADENDPPDSDVRELEFKKNNYGPVSESILLRFRNGLFLPVPSASTLDRLAKEQRVDTIFVAVLRKLIEQGRSLSPNRHASNYAPSAIAAHPDGNAYRKRDYADAMERLLAAKTIHVEGFGPPSRNWQRIVL